MVIRISLWLIILITYTQDLKPQSWWNNTYSFKYLDINKISIPLNNIGGIDRRLAFWFSDPNEHNIVFNQGLWVVGKINNNVHLAMVEWLSSYSPGPIIGEDAAMNVHPEDSTKYRVYKIDLDDLENGKKDYLEWPSDYGAPVNAQGFPIIYADQSTWTIYNSLDSSIYHRKRWNERADTLPVMPIEVHQLAYAYETGEPNWIEDVVFFEWTIINKGLKNIDSTYFGFWTDIDFNGPYNFPAVDTSIQLGYCWSPADSGYDYIPLAVGYLFKYGPIISSKGDSAVFKGIKKENFKNLSLTSFHGIGDDSYRQNPLYGPAWSLEYAWNFARGLDGEGNIIIDSSNGLPTKFPFSGDPVTETGYLFPGRAIGGGAGFVMFSGPVNLAPNDTQWVMAALIASSGNDYKDAIVNLREKTRIIKNIPYNLLVEKHSVELPPIIAPEDFYLSQNYPNPFNNETRIFFEIPFQTKVELSIYDLLGRKVKLIINEIKEPNHYDVSFNGKGLASGVYFYRMKAEDFIQTKKMLLLK